MIFAVIPAAGKSTRMGRPKLALPLEGDTVLGAVIRRCVMRKWIAPLSLSARTCRSWPRWQEQREPRCACSTTRPPTCEPRSRRD